MKVFLRAITTDARPHLPQVERVDTLVAAGDGICFDANEGAARSGQPMRAGCCRARRSVQ
jgi:hypothetical protein